MNTRRPDGQHTGVPIRNLLIVNRLGLHARAAAKFVERAQAFEANIRLGTCPPDAAELNPDRWVDGKSIMSVMLLAASKGTAIQLSAEGNDEQAALDAISELIADRFGEPE